MVHNGGSPNFKVSFFNKKTTYMAQILQSFSYKVCFIILPKFNKFGLLILILGTSAIMDQTGCCYNVTTSEIGLYIGNNNSLLINNDFDKKVSRIRVLYISQKL